MTWDDIQSLGIGVLGLTPWDFGRFTLNDLYYRAREHIKAQNEQAEVAKLQFIEGWRQTRWMTFRVMRSLGVSDLTSEYQLIRLPGDPKPKKKGKTNWLAKFPKQIK